MAGEAAAPDADGVRLKVEVKAGQEGDAVDTHFFGEFAAGAFFIAFAGENDAARAGVQETWVDVLGEGAALDVELAGAVPDQDVGGAVGQSFGAHLFPRGRTNGDIGAVDDGHDFGGGLILLGLLGHYRETIPRKSSKFCFRTVVLSGGVLSAGGAAMERGAASGQQTRTP